MAGLQIDWIWSYQTMFLFVFSKTTKSKSVKQMSAVQWYFPLLSKRLFAEFCLPPYPLTQEKTIQASARLQAALWKQW